MLALDYQNVTEEEMMEAAKLASKYGVSTASPIVNAFELKIANILDTSPSNVVATNSGTSALHLALIGAGVKPGDRVVVPVLTFASTLNAISYVGAEPVFCDVNKDTWLMNTSSLAWTLAMEFTGYEWFKFIMPVDLYGNLVDTADILDYYNYMPKVILDSAESFGVREPGYADFTCFSFNGNKVITTGGGGLLLGGWIPVGDNWERSNQRNNADLLRKLSTQAKNTDGSHFDIGFNYRMPGINAAIGLGQLDRLDSFLSTKRRINQIYKEELSEILTFQKETPGSVSSWWFTAALWPEGTDIEEVQKRLQSENVPTRRIFRPLNQSKPWRDEKRYPVAEMIYQRGLCLPGSTRMDDIDVYYVVEKVKEIVYEK